MVIWNEWRKSKTTFSHKTEKYIEFNKSGTILKLASQIWASKYTFYAQSLCI